MSKHLDRIWDEVKEAYDRSKIWGCDDWEVFLEILHEIIFNHKDDITDTT